MKKNLTIHLFICLFIFIFCGVKTGWGQECIPRGTNEGGCGFTIITIGLSVTKLNGKEKYNIGTDIDIETARQAFTIETSCEQLSFFAVFFKINGEEGWKLQTKGSFKEYFLGNLFFPMKHINTREFPEQTKVRVKLSSAPIETACSSLQSDSNSAQSRNRGIEMTMDCGVGCRPCPGADNIIKPISPINDVILEKIELFSVKNNLSKFSIYPSSSISMIDEAQQPNSAVSNNPKYLSKLSVYPNPAYENTNISFTLAQEDLIEILLVDISGKQKLLKLQRYPEGENITDLSLLGLPSGFYTIILKTTHTIETLKVIKY